MELCLGQVIRQTSLTMCPIFGQNYNLLSTFEIFISQQLIHCLLVNQGGSNHAYI